MEARPGVKKGKDVPEPSQHSKDPEKMKKMAEEASKWVQQGMKEDASKNKM